MWFAYRRFRHLRYRMCVRCTPNCARRTQKLRIVVGLWNFSDDPLKVNRRLGLAEGARAFTTLAEIRQELEGATDAVTVAAVPVPGADD